MQRRGFLKMLGSVAVTPLLPAAAMPTAPAVYSRYMYGLAVFQARTRATLTIAELAKRLGVTPAQSQAMMSEMASNGVITSAGNAIAGTWRAVRPNGHSAQMGRIQTHSSQPQIRSKGTPKIDTKTENTPMEKFEKITGVAAPMPLVNIDTDMIIPKGFLKTIKRTGLGVHAFDEMRYNQDGSENPDFVLNKAQYRDAEILVAGDNFGCGSSREHAPWALKDFGIRAIISTSFADIFFNNCFKNGILPIVLPQAEVDLLMKDAEKGSNARMTVDLEAQEITTSDGEVVKFEVDEFKKHCLLNGLDDIGLTMEKAAAIDTFEASASQARPWV